MDLANTLMHGHTSRKFEVKPLERKKIWTVSYTPQEEPIREATD
jgi:hypothetical protein